MAASRRRASGPTARGSSGERPPAACPKRTLRKCRCAATGRERSDCTTRVRRIELKSFASPTLFTRSPVVSLKLSLPRNMAANRESLSSTRRSQKLSRTTSDGARPTSSKSAHRNESKFLLWPPIFPDSLERTGDCQPRTEADGPAAYRRHHHSKR